MLILHSTQEERASLWDRRNIKLYDNIEKVIEYRFKYLHLITFLCMKIVMIEVLEMWKIEDFMVIMIC